MKVVIALLIFTTLAVAYEDLNDAYYNTLMNQSNLDELSSLINCFIDKGPCNDFGKNSKEHIKEVLKDGCNECDNIQKHYTHVFLATAKAKLPQLYRQLVAKYDPKGNLMDAVDEKMKNYQ